jgi:hypothetical protein
MLEMNEALLVSLVRQHELAEHETEDKNDPCLGAFLILELSRIDQTILARIELHFVGKPRLHICEIGCNVPAGQIDPDRQASVVPRSTQNARFFTHQQPNLVQRGQFNQGGSQVSGTPASGRTAAPQATPQTNRGQNAPQNAVSHRPYSGCNIVLLWLARNRGWATLRFLTFKQAIEAGGHVRKGEHGSLVVYADRIHKTETGDNGDEIEREIPFLKGYTVFCVEQIDGLPEHFYARPSPPLPRPRPRA